MKDAEPVVSRRDFAKRLAAGAAMGTAAAALPVSAKAAVKKNRTQYGMVIDTRRCIGCQACTVACKSEFDVPLGVGRTWVEDIEKGEYPNVTRNFLPRNCNHCSKPPCVRVCPTGATWKREEDGVVVIDKDICIGCKYCIEACPYDARFFNPVTRTADKCEFCLHRVKEGMAPACVNTCQGRARIFGDLNDPDSEVSNLIAENPVTALRTEMGTQPNVFYIAADHWDPHTHARYEWEYIRVTTNRRRKQRR
jgi:tetrathionate reductase subunit B